MRGNNQHYNNLLTEVEKKYDELEKDLRKDEHESYFKFSSRRETLFEFRIGSKHILLDAEILIGAFNVVYEIKAYLVENYPLHEEVLAGNVSSHGLLHKTRKPELDLVGDYEMIWFKNIPKENLSLQNNFPYLFFSYAESTFRGI